MGRELETLGVDTPRPADAAPVKFDAETRALVVDKVRRRKSYAHANTRRYVRVALFAFQNGMCAICGRPMPSRLAWLPNGAVISLPLGISNLDHVIPRSRGGVDRGNVVLTHATCNRKRGSAPATACELLFLYVVNLKLGLVD